MPILYLVGRRFCILSAGLMGGLYTLVEFVLCSLIGMGNFQGLNEFNEQVVQAPRFLFLCEITKNMNPWLVGS